MENEKFVWSDEYSVGVKEIDEQHREFFSIINGVYDLLESGNVSNETLYIRIARLGDYAFYHLSTEEEYFSAFGYENAQFHVGKHNAFRERAEKFIDQARNQKADLRELVKTVADFSKDWLSQHILVEDKQYSKFFQEHGLK